MASMILLLLFKHSSKMYFGIGKNDLIAYLYWKVYLMFVFFKFKQYFKFDVQMIDNFGGSNVMHIYSHGHFQLIYIYVDMLTFSSNSMVNIACIIKSILPAYLKISFQWIMNFLTQFNRDWWTQVTIETLTNETLLYLNNFDNLP